LAEIAPFCQGLPFPIPGVCSGGSSAAYDDTFTAPGKRLTKKQRQHKKQLKRCCKQFPGQIPQCEEPETLQCVMPDPSMKRIEGKKKRKQRAKQCFVTLRKEARQCNQTLTRNPDLTRIPTFPDLVPAEELISFEQLAEEIEEIESYVGAVMKFSRAFPRQALSMVHSEVYGFDAVALAESAQATLDNFASDPRYAQYR
jgi:hypothetical protein